MTVHDSRPTDSPAPPTGPDEAASPAPAAPTLARAAARATERSRRRERRPRRSGPSKPKLRKLRILVVAGGVVTIAAIALVFGMLTAVASDLPQLSNQVQFHKTVDSVLYDSTGQEIGTLAPPNKAVIDDWNQISQNMVHSIVAVEDHDFWTDPGIDLKSIGRAFVADITGGARQGASTIAEEFVKNALAEEDNRTVFEKLREAGLAFQLVHRWKRTKILTEYLNIIYFGNGAYGIESAARTYFGKQLGYDAANPADGSCGTPSVARPHMPSCASRLRPYQAALLAGMVANPTAFDPVLHPQAARERRQLVLQKMLQYGYITRGQYARANAQPLPVADDIQQATEPAAAPYFTSWVRPLIIRALEQEGVSAKDAQYEAYYGGLKIKLSINLRMQQAAQQAVDSYFPSEQNSPTASLVSISNQTGEVKAMVSGNGDYEADPFNLATLGYRQPGSSFKLFTLVQALESGRYSPASVVDSHFVNIRFRGPHGGIEHFPVHNDEDSYLGPISLQEATDVSDNSVFAQVGMSLGTKNIAHQATLLGIRSPVSTNPAMIIGGLTHGVSALDMAHAYETIATGGKKVYNPVLGDISEGPIGIQSISGCAPCEQHTIVNRPVMKQVVPTGVADTIHQMLGGVVSSGTGQAAAIPGVEVVGKTGTTSNYVDAWFCGWTSALTTCVWVGYPNSGKPMLTNYNGGPVVGGSFPALIWKNYTETALEILADNSSAGTGGSVATTPDLPDSGLSTSSNLTSTGAATAPASTAAAGNTGNTGNTGAGQTAAGTGQLTTAPAAGATTTPATVQTTPAASTPPTSGASGNTGSSGTTGGAGLGG